MTGFPLHTTPIVVNGEQSTIDGPGSVRAFEVAGPGGKLWLRDLAITGGSATDFGGGIANIGGTVRLNSCQVAHNSAGVAGGGIANATFDPSSVARLELIDSSVIGNHQTLPPSENEDSGLGGGGVANIDGTAVLV